MKPSKNVTVERPGTSYGYWVINHFAGYDRNRNALWNCTCTACGRQYNVRGFSLRSGKTRHCRHCNSKGFDNL